MVAFVGGWQRDPCLRNTYRYYRAARCHQFQFLGDEGLKHREEDPLTLQVSRELMLEVLSKKGPTESRLHTGMGGFPRMNDFR